MNIIVNEELKAYIDPLTPEEYESLERSLLAEGCQSSQTPHRLLLRPDEVLSFKVDWPVAGSEEKFNLHRAGSIAGKRERHFAQTGTEPAGKNQSPTLSGIRIPIGQLFAYCMPHCNNANASKPISHRLGKR